MTDRFDPADGEGPTVPKLISYPTMPKLITEDEHQAALNELREELKYARAAGDSQRRRENALHEARKGWGAAVGESAEQYARRVTSIAAALDAFVAMGAIYATPEPPRPVPAAPVPWPAERPNLAETVRESVHRMTWTPAVVAAAVAWVQRAHLDNMSGPENWRNWADDHDIDLINTVLHYLGKPALERKDPT